ncbi:hypothetical protein SIN8267_02056 [Sinobacterium norvegicum]|uniref:Uncharacterized protein n=1 Tax=Sinobacterium norvegicum TaxID=1641715 RepID=A0ABN8EHP9_9GAMM|nr:hypothetical protein [Sinobacterium norvegicum]CAH0991941.1 hypothetical protein SIN8267_02056 [Sinobacterium norvegicum]
MMKIIMIHLCSLLSAILLCFSVPANAAGTLTVGSLPSVLEFDFSAGDESSTTVFSTIDFCIRSTSIGGFFSGNGDYAVKAASVASVFELTKDGTTIPYTVDFTKGNAAFTSLVYDTYSSRYSPLVEADCEPVSLRVSILLSDIKIAPSGTYIDTLTFDAVNYSSFFGSGFFETIRDQEILTIAFTIPKQVKISGLEDLTLTGDDTLLSAEDSDGFCVFATWGSLYSITATSLEGSFELRDGAKTPTLPYDVLIKNSASSAWSSALDYGVQAPGDRYGDADQGCSAGNNMDLRIEADPSGVNAGTYIGTLYLTVRPI